jgi:hypothetical protein
MSDGAIASLLNRFGNRTAKGLAWTQNRVCVLRNDRGIDVYVEGERKTRGELTLQETARALQVSKATGYRLIQLKQLPAKQACRGAPWIIRQNDLDALKEEPVQLAGSLVEDPNQLPIQFQ